MKPYITLTVVSLLSILLLSIHIAEEIVLGFAGGGLENLVGIAILVVYLCGTLLLRDRRGVLGTFGTILSARAFRSARAVQSAG